MTRKQLIDYLDSQYENGEFGPTREELERFGNEDLFDAWLTWEGICGYTDSILKMVKDLNLHKVWDTTL